MRERGAEPDERDSELSSEQATTRKRGWWFFVLSRGLRAIPLLPQNKNAARMGHPELLRFVLRGFQKRDLGHT
jgi:hypothetical protein